VRGPPGGRGMGAARRLGGLFLAAAILALDASPPGRHLLRLPPAVVVPAGQPELLRLDVPGGVAVRVAGPEGGMRLDGSPAAAGAWRRVSGRALLLYAERPGSFVLGLRLFGLLPWRALRVEAVPVPEVLPGGQSIGVVLQGIGPLIVRLGGVPGPDGMQPSPAGRAGLGVGTYLLAVGGVPAASAAAVQAAVQSGAGRPLPVTALLPSGRRVSVLVHPVLDAASGRYALGAWVRDQGSGIGTLTFASGPAGIWGALGHPVVDPTTGRALLPRAGWLLQSVISGLAPGRDGHPGEKEGSLVGGQAPLGTVAANSDVGVFGRLTAPLPAGAPGPLPVALEDQVHPGPARMWTVLHGERIRSFAVRIVAVLPQRREEGRGLVLQVTDPALLAESGGIVQGMSGSPIVQDGRLVGAVTHVLVDDPARGYGVLAIWMAERAGLTPAPPAATAV
jgi:stage IV sporulation protein B